MIRREPCILVTFPTTTAALSMEKAAVAAGLPGRLVPLPAALKEGCGLGWKAPAAERDRLALFAREQGLAFSRLLEAVL